MVSQICLHISAYKLTLSPSDFDNNFTSSKSEMLQTIDHGLKIYLKAKQLSPELVLIL